jgi:cytosine/creatinine deaminase
MSADDEGFKIALEEAKKGASEGGIPIGACLVSKDGKILGRGHNMRLQKSSATLHVRSLCIPSYLCMYALTTSETHSAHQTPNRPYTPSSLFASLQTVPNSSHLTIQQAEISTLESAGRLPASAYSGATMYTTLSPCNMCTGACILYKIARVVMGENKTLVGGEKYLAAEGIELVNLHNAECEGLMAKFVREHPDDWLVLMRG